MDITPSDGQPFSEYAAGQFALSLAILRFMADQLSALEEQVATTSSPGVYLDVPLRHVAAATTRLSLPSAMGSARVHNN